jgi:hypothetical protein
MQVNRSNIIERVYNSPYYIGSFVISFLLLLTNITYGKSIIGYDNYSPYFGFLPILDKVLGGEGNLFVSYVPLFFITPLFSILRTLGIQSWTISNIYIFSSLLIGITGMGVLTRDSLKKINKELDPQISFFIGFLFYLTSLSMVWIFNQPNFLFVAGYASIPWMIYYGINIPEFRLKRLSAKHLLLAPFLIYTVILYLQTALNLVAFFSYTASIIIITLVFISNKSWKLNITKYLGAIGIFFGVFLIVLQIILLFSEKPQTLYSAVNSHLTELKGNDFTGEITDALREAGNNRNTLVNTARSATNWMEISTSNGHRLFGSYTTYESPIFIILGLIPIILALSATYIRPKERNVILLTIIMIVGLLANSRFLIILTEDLGVLHDAFRWPSSKLWPLMIIPMVLLASLSISEINRRLKNNKLNNLIILGLILIQFAYILPAVSGNLVSESLQVEIPNQYYEFAEEFNKTDYTQKVLYLPSPEDLYFYTYEWGYWGSSFTMYMTRGDMIETGLLEYFYSQELYDNANSAIATCNREAIKILENAEIDQIFIDNSIKSEEFIDNSVECEPLTDMIEIEYIQK